MKAIPPVSLKARRENQRVSTVKAGNAASRKMMKVERLLEPWSVEPEYMDHWSPSLPIRGLAMSWI